MIDTIETQLEQRFGTDAEVLISSPGRINLIGEHTDYNDGLVLPAAINKRLWLGFSKNTLSRARVVSLDFDDLFECTVNLQRVSSSSWTRYVESILVILNENGYVVGGFDTVFGGNIPLGAGLSSSASLNCGLIYGLSELFGLDIKKLQIVKMAQNAEHLIGLNCGILDQFAIVHGEKDSFLKLDCRDSTYKVYSSNFDGYSLVLLDTKVKHELTDSAYNSRRKDCEDVLKVIKTIHSNVKSVRDITK